MGPPMHLAQKLAATPYPGLIRMSTNAGVSWMDVDGGARFGAWDGITISPDGTVRVSMKNIT